MLKTTGARNRLDSQKQQWPRKCWKIVITAVVFVGIIHQIHQSYMSVSDYRRSITMLGISFETATNNTVENIRKNTSSIGSTINHSTLDDKRSNDSNKRSVLMEKISLFSFREIDNHDKNGTIYHPGSEILIQNKSSSQSNSSWATSWVSESRPARILFIHVGKTGGVSLYGGVPLHLEQKRKALPCLMEYMNNGNKSSTYTTISHLKKALVERRNQKTSEFVEQNVQNAVPFERAWSKCYLDSVLRKNRFLSPLTRRVISHKHMQSSMFTQRQQNWVLNQAIDSFLISIRNPLDRLESAFNYHRHRARRREEAQQREQRRRQTQQRQISRDTQNKERVFELGLINAEKRLYHTCFPSVQSLADTFTQASALCQRQKIFTKQEASAQDAAGSSNPIYNSSTGTMVYENKKYRRLCHCAKLGQCILQAAAHGNREIKPTVCSSRMKLVTHLIFNYQYYVEQTIRKRPDVPVAVIRTEQLWSDAHKINNALLDQEKSVMDDRTENEYIDYYNQSISTNIFPISSFKSQSYFTHGSEAYKNQNESNNSTFTSSSASPNDGTGLLKKQKQALCCIIYQDLEAYQSIVLRALNIPKHEKLQMLQKVQQNDCGVKYHRESSRFWEPTVDSSESNNIVTENNSRADRNAFPKDEEEDIVFSFSWREWHGQYCSSFSFQGEI